jgi:hypothetical protein
VTQLSLTWAYYDSQRFFVDPNIWHRLFQALSHPTHLTISGLAMRSLACLVHTKGMKEIRIEADVGSPASMMHDLEHCEGLQRLTLDIGPIIVRGRERAHPYSEMAESLRINRRCRWLDALERMYQRIPAMEECVLICDGVKQRVTTPPTGPSAAVQ